MGEVMKIINIIILICLINLFSIFNPIFNPIFNNYSEASDVTTLEIAAGLWYEIPSIGLDINSAQLIESYMNSLGLPSMLKDQFTVTSNFKVNSVFNSGLLLMAHVRFEHNLPVLPNIYILYSPISLHGSININGQINLTNPILGTSSIQLSQKNTINETMHMVDVSLYTSVFSLENTTQGWFDLDLGLAFKVLTVPSSLLPKGTTLPISFLPIPNLYVAFQVAPYNYKKIAFEAESHLLPGFMLSSITNQVGASVYDFLGRLKWNFYESAFVAAGYRYQTIAVGSQGINVSIITQGPFAEVGF